MPRRPRLQRFDSAPPPGPGHEECCTQGGKRPAHPATGRSRRDSLWRRRADAAARARAARAGPRRDLRLRRPAERSGGHPGRGDARRAAPGACPDGQAGEVARVVRPRCQRQIRHRAHAPGELQGAAALVRRLAAASGGGQSWPVAPAAGGRAAPDAASGGACPRGGGRTHQGRAGGIRYPARAHRGRLWELRPGTFSPGSGWQRGAARVARGRPGHRGAGRHRRQAVALQVARRLLGRCRPAAPAPPRGVLRRRGTRSRRRPPASRGPGSGAVGRARGAARRPPPIHRPAPGRACDSRGARRLGECFGNSLGRSLGRDARVTGDGPAGRVHGRRRQSRTGARRRDGALGAARRSRRPGGGDRGTARAPGTGPCSRRQRPALARAQFSNAARARTIEALYQQLQDEAGWAR